MREVRELLRLKFACKLTHRQIGLALKLSPSTISYYTRAFVAAKLVWPLSPERDDVELIKVLTPYCEQFKQHGNKKIAPDFAWLHKELKNKCVTRELLYEEYKQQYGKQSYSYAEFCRRYREYKKTLQPSLRHTHRAGEKLFVDYAGPRLPYYDVATGQCVEVMIFVGVLGASNYTFAEATLTRSLPDWIGSHNRMFAYFGGVTQLLIPDNEKSAVTKASFDVATLNGQMVALASHYNTTVLPTRPAKPKDKAKVEKAVQCVERWIMAKLRHRQFFSLAQINQAIAPLLEQLNHKPFKKMAGSRAQWFEQMDKPALKPLPEYPYEYAVMKEQIVALDYHITVDRHHYSVPHQLIKQRIFYKKTRTLLEVFHHSKRVAAHPVSHVAEGKTTVKHHMPKAHQRYCEWTPQVFLTWMETLSASLHSLTKTIITQQPHPECCYRIYKAMRRLHKHYGTSRFIKACLRADLFGMTALASIESMLKAGLEQLPTTHFSDKAANDSGFISQHHECIRGAMYYQSLLEEDSSDVN